MAVCVVCVCKLDSSANQRDSNEMIHYSDVYP